MATLTVEKEARPASPASSVGGADLDTTADQSDIGEGGSSIPAPPPLPPSAMHGKAAVIMPLLGNINLLASDSPVFRDKLAQLEDKVEHTLKTVRNLGRLAKETLSGQKAQGKVATSFATDVVRQAHEISSGNEDGSETLAHVLKQSEHFRTLLTMSLENVFVTPMETFAQQESNDLRDLKKRYDTARAQHKDAQAALQKVQASKSKSADMAIVSSSQARVSDSRRALVNATSEYIAKLYETDSRAQYEFLDAMNAYLFSYLAYFQQGMDLLGQCEPLMSRMSTLVKVDRRAFEREREDLRTRVSAWEASESRQSSSSSSAAAAPGAGLGDDPGPRGDEGPAAASGERDVKEGYLQKQSRTGFKDWKKRWFVVKGGMMYYYRSWKDLKPQGTINLLYSSVKVVPNASKRNTFQVITHQHRTYTLQGDDMQDWIDAIQHSTALLLDAMTPQAKSGGESERAMNAGGEAGILDGAGAGDGTGEGGAGADGQAQLTPFQKLLSLEDNRRCADCGAPEPEWASINLGVTICIACSGIHRSLGTHITKVRSAKLDSDVWDAEMVGYMTAVGNGRANEIWEGGVPPRIHKPEPGDPLEAKKEWITQKYQHRRFVRPSASHSPVRGPDASETSIRDLLVRLNTDLHEAVEKCDVMAAYACIVYGADVNAPRPGDADRRPPLHAAVASGDPSLVQMLVSNGAMADAPDAKGWLPVHVAAVSNTVPAARILLRTNTRLIDAKTRDGDTAIEIASVEGSAEVEKLLIALKMFQVQKLIESNASGDFTTFEKR